MDWIHFDLELPHSLNLSAPAVAPSSPSCASQDGPGFSIRRSRTAQAPQQAATLPMMPPALRFPAPMTLWTA
jgi:hypothetical protein